MGLSTPQKRLLLCLIGVVIIVCIIWPPIPHSLRPELSDDRLDPYLENQAENQPETQPESPPKDSPETALDTTPVTAPETAPVKQPETQPEKQPENPPKKSPETAPVTAHETNTEKKPEKELENLSEDAHFVEIRNQTLGVEKIFVINLPSRLDKRDNLILGSSVSDFQVDFIDGVTPEQINPKIYPYNWNYDHRPPEFAARRAHLNVLQRIVNDQLGSAIILEDDVDWDVTIKSQLQSFAFAVRQLQGHGTLDPEAYSPYGDDWDVLWFGHCGATCRTDEPWFLTPDPTVLPPNKFKYWRDPPPLEKPDNERLTCTMTDGVCSNAYAVSAHGARKLLSALSVNPSGIAEQVDIGAQFDVSLGRLCGSGYLRCFAPYPSLVGGYSSGGASKKGSDINGAPEEDIKGPMEPPFSYGVWYSTMMNINRLLNGEVTVHANWPDLPIHEIDPETVRMVRGTIKMPNV